MDSKYSKHSVHRQRVFLPAQGEHGAANCPERQQKAREKLNILHLQCTHDMRSPVHQKQTVIEVMVIILCDSRPRLRSSRAKYFACLPASLIRLRDRFQVLSGTPLMPQIYNTYQYYITIP